MRKNGIYGLLSLAALMLAGCQADFVDGHRGEVPIVLTTTVLESHGPMITRAGIDLQSTQLPNGATFEAAFTGSEVTVSNAIYTADGLGGATTTPQPYFALTGTNNASTTVHAFYPSKPSDDTFSVQADQRDDADYKASDLMYATATIERTSPTGVLTFTHKMAKIIVNVTLGDGISSINAVKIVGGYRTISVTDATTCTLGDVSGTPFSADSPLTIFSGTHSEGTLSCAALIPPQTVISSDLLLITTDQGNIIYSVGSKTFATGQSYTFNMTVTAAAIGTTIDITDWADNGSVTIAPYVPERTPPGVTLVDLGLPSGILWASRNIGAISDTDYGLYFAWGDIIGRSVAISNGTTAADGYSFSWTNTPYNYGSSNFAATKYNATDGLTVLEPCDDAAYMNWGGKWRMPTLEECQELWDNTTHVWTSNYNSSGVAGYTFTGNGHTLFLPAAGFRNSTNVRQQGVRGDYRSSTIQLSNLEVSCVIYFAASEAYVGTGYRYNGFSIRPVYADRPASSYTYAVTVTTGVDPMQLQLGDIIYADGSWSRNNALDNSKTAVGVVVYVASSSGDAACEAGKTCRNGSGTVTGKVLVMSLQDVSGYKAWFTANDTDHDNTLFPNCSNNTSIASLDFRGYEKTRQMATNTGECASHTHAAATEAWNYVPTGATGSSPYLIGSTGWFLPSIGQWFKVFQAMGGSTVPNAGSWSGSGTVATTLSNYITTVGGNASTLVGYYVYWSSSEFSGTNAQDVSWYTDSSGGFTWGSGHKSNAAYVRPFLAY